jgi:hypothetical protein
MTVITRREVIRGAVAGDSLISSPDLSRYQKGDILALVAVEVIIHAKRRRE